MCLEAVMLKWTIRVPICLILPYSVFFKNWRKCRVVKQTRTLLGGRSLLYSMFAVSSPSGLKSSPIWFVHIGFLVKSCFDVLVNWHLSLFDSRTSDSVLPCYQTLSLQTSFMPDLGVLMPNPQTLELLLRYVCASMYAVCCVGCNLPEVPAHTGLRPGSPPSLRPAGTSHRAVSLHRAHTPWSKAKSTHSNTTRTHTKTSRKGIWEIWGTKYKKYICKVTQLLRCHSSFLQVFVLPQNMTSEGYLDLVQIERVGLSKKEMKIL